MQEFTCIVCPNGCHLQVEIKGEEIQVTGNGCMRGEAFAREEITHPMRSISTTVRTSFQEASVLPVRVSAEIPKEKIFDVMNAINQYTLQHRVKAGDVIIKNVENLSVDVIATSDLLATK